MDGNTIKMPGKFCLAFITLLALTAFRCEKDELPFFEDIIFVLPLRINPPDSLISLGDTLWLTANIADTLYEYNSLRYYKLQKSPFISSFMINNLVNKEIYHTYQPGAVALFEFANITGFVHALSQSFGTLTFLYRDNRYELEIGIVPKSTGVFAFSLLQPSEFDLSSLKLEPTKDGRKRIPVYRGFFFVINEGETNFSLFQAHCKPGSLEYPTPANVYFEQKGTFTFRVVE